jgi:outer membrane protein OmpA-like peptidoglycan-associated protein
MTLAASLIAAGLGDRVRREGLSASGLTSWLSSQRDFILKMLPGALASIGGLSALRGWGDSAASTARTVERRTTTGLGWLPWAAIAAVALLALAWAVLRNTRVSEVPTPNVPAPLADAAKKADQVARAAADAPARVANQAGQAASNAAQQGQLAIANLGAFVTRKLPGSIEIGVPEHGVESQVIAYLGDPSKQLEPVVWFNFDRLLFETGSATLKPESREQLKNIAEILKAYPNVKMKIGGYTDNVGDPASNLKLSQERATNVAAAIVALGVAPDRLTAEGFGEQFPVADNSSEAGRQQNRRIALRVTEK